MEERLRVLFVEDHQLLHQLVAMALAERGMEVRVADDLSPAGILSAAAEFRPHVVLLDLLLPEPSTPVISELAASSSVVVLTGSADPLEHGEALAAGAVGVVVKGEPLDRVEEAVRTAASGGAVMRPAERDSLIEDVRRRRTRQAEKLRPFQRLTQTEQEVLAALLEGKQADQIASERYVSLATVRTQIRGILEKLEVSSQLSAVALARQAGWVGPDNQQV